VPIAACRAAIERFRAACACDELVRAAFLGGSFAAGRATERSDVDVYVVVREADYDRLWERRRVFVEAMGAPVLVEEHRDFEGLGFDLVHFELADGVTGEVAYAHTGNFLRTHGGPHEVLVDRDGLLDGVAFPLL
jgi:predicted nucleotidyltransferase